MSLSEQVKIASFHLDGITDEQIGDAFGIKAETVAAMREDDLWQKIEAEILRALVQDEIITRKPVITTEEKIRNIIHETEIPPNETLDVYTRLEAEVGISRESSIHWVRRVSRENKVGRQT